MNKLWLVPLSFMSCMQCESSSNVVLYYIFKEVIWCNLKCLHFEPTDKTLRKGKFYHFFAFTPVHSIENILCKSGIKNHFHNICGTKSWIFANSVLSILTLLHLYDLMYWCWEYHVRRPYSKFDTDSCYFFVKK